MIPLLNMNNENKNPADNNRQDFCFGKVVRIRCVLSFWAMGSNPYIFYLYHFKVLYLEKFNFDFRHFPDVFLPIFIFHNDFHND